MSRSTYIYLITNGYANDPVGAYTVKYEAQAALRDALTAGMNSLMVTVFRHGKEHGQFSVEDFLK
jgi:hypothetical protein